MTATEYDLHLRWRKRRHQTRSYQPTSSVRRAVQWVAAHAVGEPFCTRPEMAAAGKLGPTMSRPDHRSGER